MFVLTISRPSSRMGNVGLKTRSPGQLLGNSCLHSSGQIGNPILMKLNQNVCHIWLTNRSPGQILENSCLHFTGHICDRICMKLDPWQCQCFAFYLFFKLQLNLKYVSKNNSGPHWKNVKECVLSAPLCLWKNTALNTRKLNWWKEKTSGNKACMKN